MARLRGQWNFGVAFVAVWIFVLQSISGALAYGQGATGQLDIFGNPLCITGSASPEHGQGGADHGGMLKCCALGCSMASQPLDAAPEFAVEILDLPLVSALPLYDYDQVAPPIRTKLSGSPRAPPVTV